MVYRKADPLSDLPTPQPCKSEVLKKALKSWSLGPQTWTFPKYVSNKTKKADDLCPGVPYPIGGLCSLLNSMAKLRRFCFNVQVDRTVAK